MLLAGCSALNHHELLRVHCQGLTSSSFRHFAPPLAYSEFFSAFSFIDAAIYDVIRDVIIELSLVKPGIE
jgi:hypothetical protein